MKYFKKMFDPATLIFLGSSITIIGAFWASIQDNQYKEKIAVKNEEIAGLATKLAESSVHIANTVTGGKSYIYFESFSLNTKNNKGQRLAHGFIKHMGGYPLHDLTITIMSDKFVEPRWRIDRKTFGMMSHIDLYPETLPFQPDIFDNYEDVTFYITYYARNGMWHQNIKFEKESDIFVMTSYEVTRWEGEKRGLVVLQSWKNPNSN